MNFNHEVHEGPQRRHEKQETRDKFNARSSPFMFFVIFVVNFQFVLGLRAKPALGLSVVLLFFLKTRERNNGEVNPAWIQWIPPDSAKPQTAF